MFFNYGYALVEVAEDGSSGISIPVRPRSGGSGFSTPAFKSRRVSISKSAFAGQTDAAYGRGHGVRDGTNLRTTRRSEILTDFGGSHPGFWEFTLLQNRCTGTLSPRSTGCGKIIDRKYALYDWRRDESPSGRLAITTNLWRNTDKFTFRTIILRRKTRMGSLPMLPC